jgi:hypothetical protein
VGDMPGRFAQADGLRSTFIHYRFSDIQQQRSSYVSVVVGRKLLGTKEADIA